MFGGNGISRSARDNLVRIGPVIMSWKGVALCHSAMDIQRRALTLIASYTVLYTIIWIDSGLILTHAHLAGTDRGQKRAI